jgi:hypothetical protein
MKLPYYISYQGQSALLYQLPDGRFQIVDAGRLAPLMIGYEYVLVEESFADYLAALDLPRLEIIDALIYEPRQRREIRTHRRLRIGQQFSSDMIRDVNIDGERLMVMDGRYVFVSPPLKERLESSPFNYIRFTEGLSGFAGEET